MTPEIFQALQDSLDKIEGDYLANLKRGVGGADITRNLAFELSRVRELVGSLSASVSQIVEVAPVPTLAGLTGPVGPTGSFQPMSDGAFGMTGLMGPVGPGVEVE